MSRSHFEDLNRQQWGLNGSEFSYARLSTKNEVFFPYDDNVEDFYSKETIPLIEEEVQGLLSKRRRSLIPHSILFFFRLSERRKRQFKWLSIVILLITFISLYQNLLHPILFPYIPPPKQLTISKQVIESKCCSVANGRLTNRFEAIQAHEPFLNEEVLENWIANGEIEKEKVDFSKHIRLDGITTWVNGTDSRHHYNRMMYSKEPEKINQQPLKDKNGKLILEKEIEMDSKTRDRLQNGDNRFRDLNELKFSVRSARKSLGPYLGTHHIISTDFWSNKLPEKGIEDHFFGNHRGQVPQWIDLNSPLVAFHDDNDPQSKFNSSSIENPIPAIRLHHDWQVFTQLKSKKDKDEWLKERLPTFDSMAVEATAGINMPGLSQIYFLASDDMFTLTNMTTSDFYSPLFGPMYQIQTDWYMRGLENPQLRLETTGVEYSVSLLRKRFGTPGFSYSAHIHKSIVHPLLMESRMIWSEEFEDATSKRFRGDGLTANSHTLTYAMTIERHREALLWSYLIAKIDKDRDGLLNDDEIKSVLNELGVDQINSTIPVKLPQRISSLKSYRNDMLKRSSFPLPKVMKPIFTSSDGYAYAEPDHSFTQNTGKRFFDVPLNLSTLEDGREDEKLHKFDFCKIDLLVCWPRDDHAKPLRSTNEIFKRFAFEHRGCGDCLINHLVGKSGKKGLNAFLPKHDQKFPIESHKTGKEGFLTDAFHLPIIKTYQTGNFSLSFVAMDNGIGHSPFPDVQNPLQSLPNLRTFAMHLITRYSYSVASATGAFEMLHTPLLSRMQLDRIKAQIKKNMAFLCLNDDISYSPSLVRMELNKFFETVWPSETERLPFEKPVWTKLDQKKK